MKTHRKKTALVTAAVVSLLALAGCSTESGGSVERASQPAPLPPVEELDGLFADPELNTPERLAEAVTAEDWAMPMEIIDCDRPGCDGDRTPGIYTPLAPDSLTEEWTVCAVYPHVKDPYWVGQNANLVQEAERMGISLQLYEAGGYTEVGTQLDQLSNCVASGADAVLVGAVSSEALNAKIDEVRAQGVVVIDLVNGVNTEVDGRAMFDYCALGSSLGRHLVATGDDVRAVWLPGPAGVEALQQLVTCSESAAEDSNVEMLGVSYGDTGKDVQLSLVENALSAYPEMNFILGSAVTLDAAVGPLTERGLTDQISTASYYFTPEVYEMLQQGTATCASAGNDMILSKIAIDMALRVLEGQPFNGGDHVGMAANVVCGPAAGSEFDNLDSLVKELNLPPADFTPTFSVN